MAITFFKEHTLTGQKKSQKILVAVLMMVAVGTGYFLWQGFLKKAPSEVISLPPTPPKQITIDFTILQDETLFKEFAQPPLPPVLPQNIGRANPFAPL